MLKVFKVINFPKFCWQMIFLLISNMWCTILRAVFKTIARKWEYYSECFFGALFFTYDMVMEKSPRADIDTSSEDRILLLWHRFFNSDSQEFAMFGDNSWRTTKDTALGDVSKGTRGMMPLLSIFILLELVGRHEFIRGKKGSKRKKVKQLNAYLPISIGTVKMSSILTQEIEF